VLGQGLQNSLRVPFKKGEGLGMLFRYYFENKTVVFSMG